MKNLLTLLFLSILLVSTISAFEFDNVKTYDASTQTITITNSFGLGSKIADVKLDTPLHVQTGLGYQKVAEYTITSTTDYSSFLKGTEVYNLNKNNALVNKKIDVKYLTSEFIDDVKYNCEYEKDGQVIGGSCKPEVIGKKEIEAWKDFNGDVKAEKITIGLFTNVEQGDYYEWVGDLAGIKTTEWATWAGNISTSIKFYYKLDEASGAVIDAVGEYNGANTGATTNVDGIINTAYDFEFSDSGDDIAIGTRALDLTAQPLTINAWIQPESFSGYGSIFSGNSGGISLVPNLNTGQLSFGKYGVDEVTSNNLVAGTLYMLTITYNASGVTFYLNGTAINIASYSQTFTNNSYAIGQAPGGTNYYDGIIDEIAVWKRSLTPTEITLLFNSGIGCQYGNEACFASPDSPPAITLNSPVNAYNSSSQDITFNCTGTDDINLSVIDLKLNSFTNGTNSSVYNNTLTTFYRTLPDGAYNWSCQASDNATIAQSTTATYRNVTIHTDFPEISVTSPTGNTTTFTMPVNVTLNTTATDFALSTCWYFTNENITPIIFTCNASQNVSFSSPGWYWINYTANDTLGRETSTNISYFINHLNYSTSYATTRIEGQNNTIYFNASATSLGAPSAYLVWNGTNYTMNLISNNGTLAKYWYYLTAPEVTADDEVSFVFDYNIDGTLYHSIIYNQTIYNIPSLNVTGLSCSDKALNFTLLDEANLSAINGTFDYNFYYGTSDNSSAVRTYGTLTDLHSFFICINDTISNAWVLGQGEIFYRATGYVDRRYYLFDGTILSNSTNNITLFDLFSTDQTSFKLEVESTSLAPYSDFFTTLVRWYPGLNQYNIVDMGLTDEKGTTIIHVKTEDVDYRIGVYYRNGTLVKLADPIRMACLTSPCTYTLAISPGDTDYTSILGIIYTFTFNETTGIWDFTYSDPSLKTTTMNLTIYRETGTTTYAICSTNVTGVSGAMTCNTSLYTGTMRGIVTRSASPGVILVQKVVGVIVSAFKSTFGLWLSMLVAIPVIFFFAMVSPLGALIGAVVALIPAYYFGSISLVIIGGIALLAGIVAHFISRIK